MICSDPRYPSDVPPATAERRFPMTSAFPAVSQQRDVYAVIGEDALDWLWDGFNATIIAHGQSGTGKTYTLHGHGIVGELEGEGLCPRILAALYNRIAHSQNGNVFTVGMSCWDVHAADVVDLLSDHEGQPQVITNNRVTTVHAANLKVRKYHYIIANMGIRQRMGYCSLQDLDRSTGHALLDMMVCI